ncbi:MAG: hypothetical protein P8075_17050 [Deltaproteobacteria bacterium]|jgi:hypothetical protein
MRSYEASTHSFIVRVWLEPRECKDAVPQFRGVVQHVPSGERIYVRDLAEIAEFIAPYLGKEAGGPSQT